MNNNDPRENFQRRQKTFQLNFLLFKRLWHLSRILFPRTFSLSTIILLILVLISLLEQYVVYNVGLIPSRFYKVLLNKDTKQFTKLTLIALGFILAISIVKGARQYTASALYLIWRQLLCLAIHRLYFSNDHYYKINVIQNNLDNPDQRVTQDVDKFCTGLSKVIQPVIISPFIIGYYSYQAYQSTGYLGPVGAFSVFLISTILNKSLMSKIVALTVAQERKEGDFRFAHMQVRVNAESLAFCGSSSAEYLKTNVKLGNLLTVQKQIINWQFLLNVIVNCFDYFGAIFSYMLLAIPIFSGHYDNIDPGNLGALISQNAFVCIYLINAFTTLVDTAVQVTDIAGNAHRIAELFEDLVKYSHEKNENYKLIPFTDNKRLGHHPNEKKINCNVGFALDSVSFHPPKSSSILVRGLTFHFHVGKNVLIMGRSSSGKTSLLRILKGLWPIHSGKVVCRTPLGPDGIFFMPCIPFLTDGSLREQIIYPLKENDAEEKLKEVENDKILDILELVGLTELAERTCGLDVPVKWNWYDKLSPGEMQRLNFARLFYHHPRLAVLDESTSAISLDIERILYEECIKRNITLISVGHRESLHLYHQILLHLDGCGGWLVKVYPVKEN